MEQIILWFIAGITFAGTILNIFKNKICFILWIISNLFWCSFDYFNGDYPQASVFGINLIFSIVGYFTWRKSEKI